jgi:hypothetical protein
MSPMLLSQAEERVVNAMRRHVLHGHGEIKIQIRPGSIRVQEGKGYIFVTGS